MGIDNLGRRCDGDNEVAKQPVLDAIDPSAARQRLAANANYDSALYKHCIRDRNHDRRLHRTIRWCGQ